MSFSREAIAIVAEFERRGVELVPDGDFVRYRPIEAVANDLLARLKREKREVLELLSGWRDSWVGELPLQRSSWPAAAHEAFEERASIIEFDANVSRADAELKAEISLRRWFAEARHEA